MSETEYILRQQADIAGLKTDVNNIKTDVTEIKRDIKDQGKKLDKLGSDIATTSGISGTLIGYNDRLNKLENWQNRIVGALVFISAVLLPILIQQVNEFLSRK